MKQNHTKQYRACRDTFFKTLYHFDTPGQSLVIDETSGRLFLRKELTYYDPSVYQFLMGCRDSRLVHVFDAWQEDGRFVVLEQYVQGELLSERLRRDDLSAQEKQTILHDVCGALEVLHSASPPIVHRDVKPENIMVTDSGRAVLMDYDASKRVKPAQSRDTVLLGTRDSAAPEQYGFGASDVRTDVYSTGKLIAAMFGNTPIYHHIVEKATRLDPKRRYPNIAALDLENVRAEKETRNYVNRTTNCEYANLDKLVAASVKQQQAVNTILRHGHFQRLPKALKEAAELRLNYPDASLQELADMADIKKSGMNHRLTRLIEYAQDLENGLV